MLQFNKIICNPIFSNLDLLIKIIQSKAALNWSREKILKIQRKRFEDILYHALTKSKFYKELYESSNITVKDIPDIKVEDLPIIDKNIMMENYDDFVCDKNLKKDEIEKFLHNPENIGKKYKNCYTVIHTSGTSGRIGIFAYDMRAWNIVKALAITRVSKSFPNPFKKEKLAFIGAVDGLYAGISLTADAPDFLYEFKPFSLLENWEENLKNLEKFGPDVLSGYSSSIYLVAKAKLDGKIDIKPKKIICSGDKMTKTIRNTIKKAFEIEPTNFYASSESLCMAADCENHKALLMFEDWHIFETSNNNSNDHGSLILTNLYNRAQPLIRYKIGDEVSLGDGQICGLGYNVIKNIGGRSRDFIFFNLPNGEQKFIHPAEIEEFFVPGLEKMQLHQTKPFHLHMLFTVEKDADAKNVKENVIKEIKKLLKSLSIEKYVEVTAQKVDDIPLDKKTGKFKIIYPYKSSN